MTFDQWDACVADSACTHRPPDKWGRGTQPVIFVDWNKAQAYINWLNSKMHTGAKCRLPNEAEWEYAARAGTTTEYALPVPDGSDDIAGKTLANCKNCGSQWDDKQTAPVGMLGANKGGLHDMHGNVWEWVEDCWHQRYEGAPDDGRAWLGQDRGDCAAPVLRGGSWLYN